MAISLILIFNVRFSGDEAELGIIRGGQSMKVQVVLIPRVHLVTRRILLCGLTVYFSKCDLNRCYQLFPYYLKVPYHIEGDQPSYLIIAGLVFTSLSEPLIEYVILVYLTPVILLLFLVMFKTNHDQFWSYFKGKNVKMIASG